MSPDDYERHMNEYYAERASYYDEVYGEATPWKDVLPQLASHYQTLLTGHSVLEVACGTGFWTRAIARTAKSVLATDGVQEPLDVAGKDVPSNVRYLRSDAFSLDEAAGDFSAGFHMQWLSHVRYSRVPGFLKRFHSKLSSGAIVVCGDSKPVPGGERDENGDWIHQRKTRPGGEHPIIKNEITESMLRDWVGDLEWRDWGRFWTASYRLRDP